MNVARSFECDERVTIPEGGNDKGIGGFVRWQMIIQKAYFNHALSTSHLCRVNFTPS
jgi:hypothetical protein